MIEIFHRENFCFSLRIPQHRSNLRLILIGSVRHDEDQRRVDHLRTLVENLNMTDEVQFKLNVNFVELKKSLNEAMIGLHTMWNEHFGIGTFCFHVVVFDLDGRFFLLRNC